MGEYIFFQIWQLYMFLLCKVNLQDNQIIIVRDFARNFLLDCQNEPQSLHWDHDQVTLMPSIAYYNCPEKECDGIVTEEVIHITPDLKHDPPPVQYFTATTLAHVTSQEVNFNEVIEWTKARQYFIICLKVKKSIPTIILLPGMAKTLQMEQLVEPKLLITELERVVRYFKVPENSMMMVKTIC